MVWFSKMINEDSLDELEKVIDSVANDLCNRHSQGRISGEESFTDILLSTLELNINGFKIRHQPRYAASPMPYSSRETTLKANYEKVSIDARSLGHKGAGSEESISGADMIVIANIDLGGETIKKGFIAQAKLSDNSSPFKRSFGDKNLREQTNRMRKVSTSAFVFRYNNLEIGCFDTDGVDTTAERPFTGDSKMSLGYVFKEFFRCNKGDVNLTAIDKSSFRDILHRSGVQLRNSKQSGLLIEVVN
jgi:hypothetical protein